jgi:hypothetical protein
MKKKVLYLLTMLTGSLMISCEQGPSLQQYFVEKMEDPSFLIVNLPIQLDSIFQKDITAKDRELISSIGKLNLLFYKKDKNHPEKYKTEVGKVKAILSEDRYQHLMDFKAFDKAQGNLLFEGKTDQIEEGIVFVDASEMGFGVLRILGDQINPAALLSLSKKIDPEQFENQIKSSVGSLGNFFDSEIKIQ